MYDEDSIWYLHSCFFKVVFPELQQHTSASIESAGSPDEPVLDATPKE